jgi:hypothetical protein
MYRPKPIPPIRIAELSAMPSYDDLLQVFNRCRQSPGRKIELLWSLNNGSQYMLVATVAAEGGDPEWNFHFGTGPRAPQIFQHSTGDIQFLLSLVSSVCTGQNVQDYIVESQKGLQSSTLFGLSALKPDGPIATSWGGGQAPGDKQEVSLEGSLSEMPAPGLLQSIVLSKMTGKLLLNNEGESIIIYFEEGTPVHATANDTRGDLAIMDLLTWQNGSFHFIPGERTMERTINRRLDAILMEGVTLLDQYQAILKAGLRMDSVLIRKRQGITEADFDQLMASAAPVELLKQKQFYIMLDDTRTLFDLLRTMPMPKTEWVPIIFNFITCDLIMPADKPMVGLNRRKVDAVPIDRSAIEGAMRSMVRPETGLFSHPLLLYFIEQEYLRYHSGGMPFSLIIFDLMLRTPQGMETLTNEAMREVSRRINHVKRSIDMLGHFETFSYGLLLPQTDLAGAGVVIQRIVEVLLDATMGGALPTHMLAMAFGIFGIPEDGTDLGTAIAGAVSAREECKKTGAAMMYFRDLRN